MEYPLKKQFKKQIQVLTKKQYKFSYSYEQATIKEFLEFQHLKLEDRMLLIYEIIHKQIPKTLFERLITFIFPNFKGKIERLMGESMQKEIIEVMQNKFKTHKSIFDYVNSRKEGKAGKGFFASTIQIICKEYNLAPDELISNYTLEQMSWLQDGIVFNYNLQTKEGKIENDMALVDRDGINERLEATRKAFESIN